MKNRLTLFSATFPLVFLICFAGCKSHPFAITVENRTGAAIRLLEVDYPSASFGKDSIDAGQTIHSGIHLTGTGAVKVQYLAPDRHQAQITGPELKENQEGGLQIVLLPGDKANFTLR